jgi:hypothetical protein
MSDIAITFPWWVLILFAAWIGAPGAVLGGAIGGLAWRAHRVRGVLAGALAGDALWAWIYLRWL